MPTISIRGMEMPASPIRKLAPLADAAKQRGIHVFHLNIGQPDLPTPEVAIEAIRNIDRKVLEYSPSAGLTVKYFSNSVNITSWELRTDACLCSMEAKVIRLMTMVLFTI